MKRRKLLTLTGLGTTVFGLVSTSRSVALSTSLPTTQLALAKNERMRLLTEFRIDADHYQFFVYDSGTDPCPESFYSEPDDNRSDLGSYGQGYITNGKTICFGTAAHLNNHWMEVYSSAQRPEFGQAEKVIALPLVIDSGNIGITSLLDLNEPMKKVAVNSGIWTVYLLAFNLGSDPEGDSEVPSDEQLRADWKAERYKMVLVPGFQTPIGVLHGAGAKKA
ncbi:MAG: hypothetical protein KME43_02605 [Myxacorys chilensis ATA2-1-KO14]|jgi:hypothetical protein|nr:hypothetical protein [Myxacorys chilensis ATA2-1-KO14]